MPLCCCLPLSCCATKPLGRCRCSCSAFVLLLVLAPIRVLGCLASSPVGRGRNARLAVDKHARKHVALHRQHLPRCSSHARRSAGRSYRTAGCAAAHKPAPRDAAHGDCSRQRCPNARRREERSTARPVAAHHIASLPRLRRPLQFKHPHLSTHLLSLQRARIPYAEPAIAVVTKIAETASVDLLAFLFHSSKACVINHYSRYDLPSAPAVASIDPSGDQATLYTASSPCPCTRWSSRPVHTSQT